MKILHLTLKKKWFDLILSGEKTIEYRERKPYWNRRFWKGKIKQYDAIRFVNGYGRDKPTMIIELQGCHIGDFEGKECWCLRLGKILEVKKYDKIKNGYKKYKLDKRLE